MLSSVDASRMRRFRSFSPTEVVWSNNNGLVGTLLVSSGVERSNLRCKIDCLAMVVLGAFGRVNTSRMKKNVKKAKIVPRQDEVTSFRKCLMNRELYF